MKGVAGQQAGLAARTSTRLEFGEKATFCLVLCRSLKSVDGRREVTFLFVFRLC